MFGQEGKLLRPKFAFLLASVISEQLFAQGSPVTEKVKAWCAVVEMIHNSSLLQDDIIDDALVRRGRPVCHSVHGKTKTAAAPLIIVGRAGQKIYELGVPGLYTTYAQAIADLPHGEYLQIKARRTIESLEEEKNLDFKRLFTEYLEKTHYKTGSLFTHLLVGAAAICGQTQQQSVKEITNFGVNLGLSFQIADDLKDITKSTHGMGKDALNDLRERNTTLPYLLALQELESKQGFQFTKQTLVQLLKQKTKSDADIEKIREIISSTKCIEATRNLIKSYYMKAEDSFGALSGSSKGKSTLRSYSEVFLDV